MKVTVFGSGYVGLVTAACLADSGNTVLCVDVDAGRIAALREGHCPFYEPGMDQLLARNGRTERLRFTTDAAAAVVHAQIIFIAVGTPPQEDGSADLQYVLDVARSIGDHMDGYSVICTKSTVPVGTARKVKEAITDRLRQRGKLHEFDVVSNPEFLKEGAAIEDFMRPDRIIVGTDSARALELIRALYAPHNRSHDRLMVMDVQSAELTKYAANAMLATRISFMNELALLAEHVGADIEAVRHGIGSDPRIGRQFLYAGCGYGGSCFPKDVKALIRAGGEYDHRLRVLEAVEAVNGHQKTVLFDRLKTNFGSLRGKTIAVWGLAFKPNTDDLREAPSRVLVEAIWSEGGSVRVYDPVAASAAAMIYGSRADLYFAESPEDACEDADALVIVTEWAVFRNPDFETLKRKLKAPVIFDGRNLFDPVAMRRMGFTYRGIGRLAA